MLRLGTIGTALCLVFACACSTPHRSGADDDGSDVDNDGDGYTVAQGDCNDNDPNINPGEPENCTDGIDNNCNGLVDGADPMCFTPCELAAYNRSSVGCVYYSVDTNSLGEPFAIAVSNVDDTNSANVVIEMKSGSTWAPVAGGTFTVGPRMLQTLVPDRRFAMGSTLYAGGAYRITSDIPVIAYQFAPLDGSQSYLSDASLLLPSSALDTYYIVAAWPYGVDMGEVPRPAHIQIFASMDGTAVTVTSPITTLAGTGVPALAPNVPQTFMLDEGDYLQLDVATLNDSFTGAYIQSTNPVGLFSSNDCANVPNVDQDCCCDHLEEQIFGLQTWGTSYVAAQMPRRAMEQSIWQILAQQDGTTVTFAPAAGVTGLPPTTTLNARQEMEFSVAGGPTPGDFEVTSDKPILVNQYTVGSFVAEPPEGLLGDPDMVQAVPTQQFLASYVVLVPTTWMFNYIVLTRQAGVPILVDGIEPSATWNPVPGGWETAVIPEQPGVYTLDSAAGFGVAVSGYDDYDSYSYPGGLNQTVINPIE